jgi:hypothetical protein
MEFNLKMKNFWKYLLLFLGVFLVVFCVALPLFGLGFMRMGGYNFNLGDFGRMPMMNGFSRGGFGLLGVVFTLFRIAIPLVLLALAVVGVVALVRRRSPAASAAAAPVMVETETCPNCGRAVEKGWSHCPYCGQNLEQVPPPPPEENL